MNVSAQAQTETGLQNNQNFLCDGVERHRETSRKYSRTRYVEFRIQIDRIKASRGCLDCGYNTHPTALQFDHRDRSLKRFKISEATCRNWENVLAEIAKCDVRCANCHAVKTLECGDSKALEIYGLR